MSDEARPPRLLRPEELGVEGHLLMIRRRGGTGGRPPREGEVLEPNRAELAEAGWTKPERKIGGWREPGPSVAELVESGRLERELKRLEQEHRLSRQNWKPRQAGRHPADLAGGAIRNPRVIEREMIEVQRAIAERDAEREAASEAG